jgi:hypothetical protein
MVDVKMSDREVERVDVPVVSDSLEDLFQQLTYGGISWNAYLQSNLSH